MGTVDLSIVVATTPDRIIGNRGELPWGKLPSDLARFKKITMETGVMVMGRKTYESILSRNGKPLPGRKHIVLTKKSFSSDHESILFVHSVEQALAEVTANGGRACVIGGGEIFKLFLPLLKVTKAYITIVFAPELEGDVYFPSLFSVNAGTKWKCVNYSPFEKRHPGDAYATSFSVFIR